MSTPTLIKTTARDGSGSQASRRERAAGLIPVIIYGHGQGNVQCKVDGHDLALAFSSSDQVFNLEVAGKKESCLVKEVQYDTFGQRILHVDFSRIDLSEQVAVEVVLEFRGDPAGVSAGGTRIVHHPKLSVNCRADSIPDVITIDVTALEIGDSLHAGEVELPSGVTLDESHLAPGEQVFAVAAPRVEIEEPAEDEEGAEGDEEEGQESEGDAEEKKDDSGS